MTMHEHTGLPELVFAAITFESPQPPDVTDDPPLHVFTMSVGFMMGKLLAQGRFRPQDAQAAMSWIAGKKTVGEVIKLIWNR
jgi:hypothetical protein